MTGELVKVSPRPVNRTLPRPAAGLRRAAAVLLAAALLTGGCATLGPKAVEHGRLDYGTAMGQSLKEQAVLNIVKSRYADWPSFLDVSSIVAAYSQSGTASLSLSWYPDDSSANVATPGVSGTFTESPTITFSPLVGADFATTVLEPLDLEAILAVAYAGWRVDRLFEVTMGSINGHRNAQFVGDALQPADPGFWSALDLFRDLQRANAWSLRRSTSRTTGSTGTESTRASSQLQLSFKAPADASDLRAKVTELEKVLGLDAGKGRFTVVYSDDAGKAGEITFETRTLLEVLWELQCFVEVPAKDQTAGKAVSPGSGLGDREAPLRIRSGASHPGDVFVAVPYGDHWFWIDDTDVESKHTLSMLLLVSTLARTGSSEPPSLVIPTR